MLSVAKGGQAMEHFAGQPAEEIGGRRLRRAGSDVHPRRRRRQQGRGVADFGVRGDDVKKLFPLFRVELLGIIQTAKF